MLLILLLVRVERPFHGAPAQFKSSFNTLWSDTRAVNIIPMEYGVLQRPDPLDAPTWKAFPERFEFFGCHVPRAAVNLSSDSSDSMRLAVCLRRDPFVRAQPVSVPGKPRHTSSQFASKSVCCLCNLSSHSEPISANRFQDLGKWETAVEHWPLRHAPHHHKRLTPVDFQVGRPR